MPPKKDAKKSDKPVAKKKEGSGGGKAKKKVSRPHSNCPNLSRQLYHCFTRLTLFSRSVHLCYPPTNIKRSTKSNERPWKN